MTDGTLRCGTTAIVSTADLAAPVWPMSVLKRAFDCAAAVVLLIATMPLVVLALILVRLTSWGPAIFRQTRVGVGGRPFTIYKVRTMRHDCERTTGPRWSVGRDPRVTWLGHWLRHTHIDELPQLWNVLRGEMSLVGPRPERPEIVAWLEPAISHYGDRLMVRPGVTGLAQLQFPPDVDLDSVRRKLGCDLHYIRCLGLGLDLRIMLGTLAATVGVPFRVTRMVLRIPSGETVEATYRSLSRPQPEPSHPGPARVRNGSDPRGMTPTHGRAEARPALTSSLPPLVAGESSVDAMDSSGSRPDVLFLAHRLPYPPDKGDRIRAFHILEWLSRHAAVHLVSLADEPVPAGAIEALALHCERVAVVRQGPVRWLRAATALACGRTATEGAFDTTGVAALLRDWAAESRFTAAVASSSGVAQYLRIGALRDVPAVVDLVDVDSQKWLDYASAERGPRAWLYHVEGTRLRRLEREVAGWARAVTLVSEAEAALFRNACGAGPIRVIGNGVELAGLEDFRRVEPREDACVFVGALDYRPNVEGACWFCTEAWPGIRHRHPGAMIRLVGRRPVAAVRRLAAIAGVEVIGPVTDVRPYLAEAAVAVAPLQIARGVQNKVLEAMAMARAVVASPGALTGLGVTPGVHALSASTPRDWVDAVSRLIADPALRGRLAAAGRSYVETQHRWERCLAPLGALLGIGDGMVDCNRKPERS